MDNERNKEIATIILQQIGGRQFTTMVGAKNMYYIENGLQLDFMKSEVCKATRLRITLKGDDTYLMQFIKKGRNFNPYSMSYLKGFEGLNEEQAKKREEKFRKSAESKVIQEYDGIWFDDLRRLFENYTGLRTSLTHIYADR